MAHDTAQTADVYFSADIVKAAKNDDGTCTVYGICSNDSLDLDGQRADPTWLKSALAEWFNDWGNIREMHQPSAVGAATALDWKGDDPWLRSLIVDPDAVEKCTSTPPVYKAYSIGVKNPQLKFDARAPKGWIVGGTIVETSLVDRPSNPDTRFELAKMVSPDEVLDVQTGTVWKRVDADTGKRDFDPNVGGGVDRDKLDSSDFVFSDERDFPIVTPGDVSDAVSSWGRYKGEHSFADFKSRLTALARRKGDRFAAELPEAWTKEDKVADPTEVKTTDADAEKSVDAPIEKDAAVEEKSAEAEAAKDASDSGDEDGGDMEMSATSEIEKAASESAYCPSCQKTVKIHNGEEKKLGNQKVLVGQCSEGHDMSKFLGSDKAADSDTEKATEAETGKDAEAEKTADADAAKDAETEKAADTDETKASDADAEKTAEAEPASKAAVVDALLKGDYLKAALLETLADVGLVDLEKVGKKMSANRLSRFNDAIDSLKTIAGELADMPADADAEKSADSAGGPAMVSNTEGLRTQLVAAVRVVNELAAQIAAGDGRFGLGDERQGDLDDLGKADDLTLDTHWDLNSKSADADTAKAATAEKGPDAIVAELAKSLGAHMERVIDPVVRRLEEVEHQTKPASPPILQVAEREHSFSAKAAITDELQNRQIAEKVASMTQAERETVLAEVLASDRGWKP